MSLRAPPPRSWVFLHLEPSHTLVLIFILNWGERVGVVNTAVCSLPRENDQREEIRTFSFCRWLQEYGREEGSCVFPPHTGVRLWLCVFTGVTSTWCWRPGMEPAPSGGDMSPLYVPRKRRSAKAQRKSGDPCPGKRSSSFQARCFYLNGFVFSRSSQTDGEEDV